MTICEGCGAAIDASNKECPYCGHSVLQRVEVQQSASENQGRTYGTTRDDEGNTNIRFGDGQTGSRLPSGSDSLSGHYRKGAGSKGSIGSERLEEKLDQVDRTLDKIPDPSKHKGSKDVGVAFLDSISSIGDLLSMYQSTVSHESKLSTDDRDRLSMKEEKIRPKLKSMVAFCEKVDSKTQKKMGLSNSDIRKIKTTATKALQMTESVKCSGCGTVNRPGSIQCQNCGAPL